MRSLFVLAEGQTEEIFIRDVLGPHLNAFELRLTPITVATKRLAPGGVHRGGIGSWAQVERELRKLLGATHVVAVTTMIDLYGLPVPWPGLPAEESGPYGVVERVERAMAERIGNERFIPYLSLHEFEALLFSDPARCERRAGRSGVQARMAQAVSECGSPEGIDGGETTAPSKRLAQCWPEYAKTSDGPALVAQIGIASLRDACPHLHEWLERLEGL